MSGAWIRVTDQLPDYDVDVIVATMFRSSVARLHHTDARGHHFWGEYTPSRDSYETEGVIWWQPLPPPPIPEVKP